MCAVCVSLSVCKRPCVCVCVCVCVWWWWWWGGGGYMGNCAEWVVRTLLVDLHTQAHIPMHIHTRKCPMRHRHIRTHKYTYVHVYMLYAGTYM